MGALTLSAYDDLRNCSRDFYDAIENCDGENDRVCFCPAAFDYMECAKESLATVDGCMSSPIANEIRELYANYSDRTCDALSDYAITLTVEVPSNFSTFSTAQVEAFARRLLSQAGIEVVVDAAFFVEWETMLEASGAVNMTIFYAGEAPPATLELQGTYGAVAYVDTANSSSSYEFAVNLTSMSVELASETCNVALSLDLARELDSCVRDFVQAVEPCNATFGDLSTEAAVCACPLVFDYVECATEKIAATEGCVPAEATNQIRAAMENMTDFVCETLSEFEIELVFAVPENFSTFTEE